MPTVKRITLAESVRFGDDTLIVRLSDGREISIPTANCPNLRYTILMDRLLTTIPAHFDGTTIQLDVPVALEPNTRLLVTILDPAGSAADLVYTTMSASALRWHGCGITTKTLSMTPIEPGDVKVWL